ncbi:MAG: carboxypeptidase regulatory-like domain-containing protein [Planctomycetia bacterium]
MRTSSLVVLVLGAVLLAVGVLALSGALPGLGGAAREGAGAGSEAALEAGAAQGAGATAQAPGSGGPRLAASEAAQRRGVASVRGRLLDVRTGKGVAQGSVLLTGVGFGKEEVALRAVTGPEGGFAWTGVAAGAGYALRAEAAGLGAASRSGLELRAGDLLDLGEVWLGEAGTLEGRVLDPQGAPVAGAEVELHAGQARVRDMLEGGFFTLLAELDRRPEPRARQATRSDGTFRFEQVSPGPHVVLVRAPGWRQALVEVAVLAGAAREPLLVRLAPGGVVAGTVVDAAGAPVPGALVVAMSQMGGPASTPLGRTFAESGLDGRFRMDTLGAAGQLMLATYARGYPTAIATPEVGRSDVRIVLRRGATLELRLLQASDGAPIEGAQLLAAVGEKAEMGSEGPSTLLVGVTDGAGAATLEAPTGSLQMLWASHPQRASAIWAATRGMKMPGMLEGPEDTTVREGRTTLTFRAPDGVQVDGRVRDGEGRGLAGAQVASVGFMGGGAKTVSDAEGRFRLVLDRSGAAMLRARLAGWVQDRMEWEGGKPWPQLEAGTREATVEVVMRTSVSVTGRVLDTDGSPLPGASVTVEAVAGEGDESQQFDMARLLAGSPPSSISLADGTYLVEDVPAGRKVRAVARRTGRVPGAGAPFTTASSGVSAAGDLRLPAAGRLEVRVLGSEGQPLEGAELSVSVRRKDGVSEDPLEEMMGSADTDLRTDARGGATVELLPPECEVRVKARAAGHAPWGATRSVGPASSPSGPLLVRLPPGRALSGTVRDASGRALAGASVQVLNAQPASAVPAPSPGPAGEGAGEQAHAASWQEEWDARRRATTDAEGRWRVADLPQGALRVRVAHEGLRTRIQPVGAEAGAVDVVLEATPADAAARLAEIDAELAKVYARFQEKDADMQALSAQLRALQQERARLAGEDE